MRRKLTGAALMLIAGIAAGHFSRIASLGVILPAAFFIRRTKSDRRDLAVFLLLFYVCGVLCLISSDIAWAGGAEYNGSAVCPMEAEVLSAEPADKGIRMECRLLKYNGRKVPCLLRQKILLRCYAPVKECWRLTGRRVCFYGRLSAPDSAGNPGCFDYRLYLRSRGISHIGTINAFRLRPSGGIHPLSFSKRRILGIREQFMARLSCDEETKGVVRGLLFGDTSAMDERIYEDFQSNGTAHVLAVSGLHIGVLYGVYRRLTRKRKSVPATAGLVFFLLFYGTMTLWSVSVTRAVLLILLVVLGDVLDRRYDLLCALSLTAMLVLLHQPYALFGAGFQMSFLAVIFINFLTPALKRHVPGEAAAMLAVQGGMIPYTAYMFNYIPLLSLLCNIPVIFLLSIAVPAGLTALLLSVAVGTPGLLGEVFCGVVQMMTGCNRLLSQRGLFSVDVVSPPLALVAAIYLCVLFLVSETCSVRRHRGDRAFLRTAAVCILGVSLIFAAADRTPFDDACAVMVDVGQGDCLHIRTAAGADVLLDGGGRKEYNVGKKILKPYLLKNRHRQVDLALATHLHTDHYRGLKELKAVYPVRRTVLCGNAGQRIDLGNGETVEILWPVRRDDNVEDENRNSMIFRVTVRGIRILVTGDITGEGERMLLDRYRGTDALKCDVLKVAHHGSRYSSTREFLKAASPKIAVIGVGRNTYGHPAEETLRRLKDCGARVFRTDRHGAVGIIATKNGPEAVTNRPVPG